MNKLKTLWAALVFVSAGAFAQTDKVTTAKIVEAKTYTFVARSAIPLNVQDINAVMSRMPGNIQGGAIQLNETYYEVKVTPDSVIAFLPYFGRSFTAPINQNEGGVKFTSTKFDYKGKKGKKRGWNITIQPNDTKESYRLAFDIGEGGYASLSLNSNAKQSITYQGYLKENESKK
ncbi:MAG: DUF4251 domain-containing protein [Pedobacter sp.]|uniref:DUF4251 domain-containing protein n=1 Tax=Pedobacter sp. TaxID=1411316 RepID=UPI002808929E|nr:DUF4251 domain-containing protein [Pedobacter sp.]MDQ8003695.1 DUF4251 domain-containing protein [Pedobacter sp.]